MRHLFDQYKQWENRLTHALVSSLHQDRRLLKKFIQWSVGETVKGKLSIVGGEKRNWWNRRPVSCILNGGCEYLFGPNSPAARFSAVSWLNEYGRPVRVLDQLGREATTEYDGHQRVKRIVKPSMAASRFKLRLRTLPENLAASNAALIISETAAMMISRFFVMASILKAKGNHRSQFNRGIIAFDGIKWESGVWDCKCLFSKRIDSCS